MSYVVKIRVATDDFYVAEAMAKRVANTGEPAVEILSVGPEDPLLTCPRCQRERLEKAP